MSYNIMTLSSQKATISEKNSLMTPLFNLFVLSRASDNTTSQNIGGTDANLKFFGGTVPPVPTYVSAPVIRPVYTMLNIRNAARKKHLGRVLLQDFGVPFIWGLFPCTFSLL